MFCGRTQVLYKKKYGVKMQNNLRGGIMIVDALDIRYL